MKSDLLKNPDQVLCGGKSKVNKKTKNLINSEEDMLSDSDAMIHKKNKRKFENQIMTEKQVIDEIMENTKSSQTAFYDDDGKLEKTISNIGLNPGDVAIRVGGEYNGVTIRALEDIKPVLTDQRISRAIKHLIKSDIQKAIGVLRLNQEVQKYGIGIIYEVLILWLKLNGIDAPSEYAQKATKINDPEIINYVKAFNWGPVNGRFEIQAIGNNHGQPIVPESWIGRKFENAQELHKEMDKLPWRKNKPPVSFCVINAMDIVQVFKLKKVSDYMKEKINVRIGILIIINTYQVIETVIKIFKHQKDYIAWLETVDKNMDTIVQNLTDSGKIMIAFNYSDLFVDKPEYIKKRSVGLLVSMMQKLLRRGPVCAQGLIDVMNELWKSPGYNLPEQQFLRVSACRQLTWRLFVTSIEDVSGYWVDPMDPSLLSMQSLAALSIICNTLTDGQLNQFVFDKLSLTASLIQRIDKKWKIMDLGYNHELDLKNTDDMVLNSFTTLSNYMPVRGWDSILLSKSFSAIQSGNVSLFKIDSKDQKYLLDQTNESMNYLGILAGMDMHPYPNLLIVFQGSLPFIPYDSEFHTTKKLWHFIWNNSSGINFRDKEMNMTITNSDVMKDQMIINLRLIQENILYPEKLKYDELLESIDIKLINKTIGEQQYSINNDPIPQAIRRLGFILLFGQRRSFKYEGKKYDIVMAGESAKEICKVKYLVDDEAKYLEGELRKEIEDKFLDDFFDTISWINPPIGYSWDLGHDNHKKIQIRTKTDGTKLKFYVNDREIKPFDASNIMKRMRSLDPQTMPISLQDVVKQALYIDTNKSNQSSDYHINLILRQLHENKLPLFTWTDIAKKSNLPKEIWVLVYVKLHNKFGDEILIGPVDSQGNALKDSISYLFEGTLWRIFNMLSMLYPETILLTNAVKSLRYRVIESSPGYIDLIRSLNLMIGYSTKDLTKVQEVREIKIVTKLWEHQRKTVDKVVHDILISGKRGQGDSSSTGSGKTATALGIMSALYNNVIKKKITSHSAFLVLLPTKSLYKTWEDEVIKHSEGFDLVLQHADGHMTRGKNVIPSNDLWKNSILITTLGRMRDHPITQPWIYVTIDECLSVQNKNALQTEQAWCQISVSLYGVLLCSATFFRARFDKLFYMLKMLGTGLPENKEYLDAILAESIVMNLPVKTRKWVTEYHPSELSKRMRKEYDELLSFEISSEKLYSKLLSYLHQNFDYVDAFSKIINKCEEKGLRCLIYAKSKDQATQISEGIPRVSRFPDTSGKHLAISFTEGTYGLNHLIYLNCIVTSIPDPDRLPQMKGRLDRPDQKENELYIQYMYIHDTIDQGALFKMEMMNTFYKDYLMPLADFYDIAVGRKSFKKIK